MLVPVLTATTIDSARVVRLTRRADGRYDIVWIDTAGEYGRGTCSGPLGAALLAWRGDITRADAFQACQGMD